MAGLRHLRKAVGLTQAELAEAAGVSRQLVGAVEAGRHLPRVDAALALASALGVDVASLFSIESSPIDVITGSLPADGTLVRVGQVGDRIVTAPVRTASDGWDVADGVVEGGALTRFDRNRPGFVVAGCEPGLEVLERLLREGAMGAVAAAGSNMAAIEALVSGRVHAAVVHGSGSEIQPQLPGQAITRFHLARWRVGLAGPPDARDDLWREALSGAIPVVQREVGAGVQRTFESSLAPGVTSVPGQRVGGHLAAARRAVLAGSPAITIEPAAMAVGASFHPLDVHRAEMWLVDRWLDERSVTEALGVVTGRRFQHRLSGVGGYDLSGCGTRAA